MFQNGFNSFTLHDLQLRSRFLKYLKAHTHKTILTYDRPILTYNRPILTYNRPILTYNRPIIAAKSADYSADSYQTSTF